YLDGLFDLLFRGKLGTQPIAWQDLLLARHSFQEAKARVEGSAADDPRWWATRGRGLAVLGRIEAAAAEVGRARTANPTDPQIRLACFQFYADQGKWDEADAELAAAARVKPDDETIWMHGFEAYAELGRQDRADAALREGAKRSTHPAEVWLGGFLFYA